jgi:hypothetical protein
MPASTDRPTAPPEFDVEAYARESDSRVRVAKPVAVDDIDELLDPSSDVRLAARPPIGDFLSLEAWACQVSGRLVVNAPLEALKQMPLDHRAGFLLSLMDGSLDLEMLVDVSGMQRDEVLQIVRELQEAGAVAFAHA